MATVWIYLGPEGAEEGRSEPFGDRQAAEDWMALAWEDLLNQGFAEAALTDLEDGSTIYRMGLGPP